jgi:fused signal recognition particle receptor
MFGFKSKDQLVARPQADTAEQPEASAAKNGLFTRLKQRLSKTGNTLTEGMATFVLGKKEIDDALLAELEDRLLLADVGVDATRELIDRLAARVKRRQLAVADALMAALHEEMAGMLAPVSQPLIIDTKAKPFVILVVGVNGVGKTTTIGKLAKRMQQAGYSPMLAAGDTFRAAAVEQLQAWGERNKVPVIAQGSGADSASVIFDAIQAARARNMDVLIADTAGRLHTQTNLMEEIKKVKRVMAKLDPTAPHEVLLVVDAGNGQNALRQAEEFNQALGASGICVTKLDGTAKGGILFAMAKRLSIPLRFIGVGEALEDLRVFNADEFVAALLGEENQGSGGSV